MDPSRDVDCYDESEEIAGWFAMIEEKLATPFETRVLGATVTVERITLEAPRPGPESPSLVLLAKDPEHWSQPRAQIEARRIVDPRVHDARIAALCLGHGVREFWTADRDFSRFPSLATAIRWPDRGSDRRRSDGFAPAATAWLAYGSSAPVRPQPSGPIPVLARYR